MIFIYRISFFITLIAVSTLAFLPNYSALPSIVSISDLINHGVAFTVLTILYCFSYTHSTQRVLFSLFSYALFIEFVQAFLPTRCASLEDVIADSVGLLIGMVLSIRIKKLRSSTGATL
ncbi:MAG: VanZ family protein [Sulfurimonas sp.]